jgi:hypothetical protein
MKTTHKSLAIANSNEAAGHPAPPAPKVAQLRGRFLNARDPGIITPMAAKTGSHE